MDDTVHTPGGAAALAAGLLTAQAGWLKSLLGDAVAAAQRDAASGEEAAQAWAQSAARVALSWRDFTSGLGVMPDLGERLSGALVQLGPVAELAKRIDWPGFAARALALGEHVLGQHGLGPQAAGLASGDVVLPRSDPRFADPAWRDQPLFALLHQLYLLAAEEIAQVATNAGDAPAEQQAALRMTAMRLIVVTDPSAFGPARPKFWSEALATRGASAAADFDRLLTTLLHRTKGS